MNTSPLEVTIAGANDAPTRLALSNILLADRQPTTSGFRVGTLYIDDLEGDSGTFSIVGGADAGVFSVSGIIRMKQLIKRSHRFLRKIHCISHRIDGGHRKLQ